MWVLVDSKLALRFYYLNQVEWKPLQILESDLNLAYHL